MICTYTFDGDDSIYNLEEVLFGYTTEEVENMNPDEFMSLQFKVEQFFGITIIKTNI